LSLFPTSKTSSSFFHRYFKSRSTAEIQRRCEILVRIIERENEEIQKKEKGVEKPKDGSAAPAADCDGTSPAASSVQQPTTQT
jgi:SLIDE